MKKYHVVSVALLLIMSVAANGSTDAGQIKPLPADWVNVTSKTGDFDFYVSKTWKQQGDDGTFKFDLNPPKIAGKDKSSGHTQNVGSTATPAGPITLQITVTTIAPTTLEAEVSDLRSTLPDAVPNSTLIKDEAAAMGTHAAWSFTMETTSQPAGQPMMHGQFGNSSGSAHSSARKRSYTVVAIEGINLYQLTFSSDLSAFTTGLSNVKKVLGTFNIAPAAPEVAAAVAAELKAHPPVITPPGMVKIENNSYHFRFFVPTSWDKNVCSDTQVAYLLRGHVGQPGDSPLFLMISGACHVVTVEDNAKEMRDDFNKHPSMKILQDQAIQLGDRPAWLFEIAGEQKMKMVSSTGTTIVHSRPVKLYEIATTIGNVIYQISLEDGSKNYDSDLTSFKKVLASFTWTLPDTK